MTTNNQGYPLLNFAFIPEFQTALQELKKMAEPEDWSYQNTPSEYDYPVLYNYIQYTFIRITEEEKIAITDDNKFSCFNTGLVTEYQEPIFMLFQENYKEDANQKWFFQKFATEGDYDLTKFSNLPSIAHYFDDPSLLVFNTELDFRPNLKHILDKKENLARFPEEYRDMSSYALMNLVYGAIYSARERVKRNYKVAIPQYFRGQMQLLLPLCLENPRKAELALTVQRYDRDWLNP